MLITPHDAIYVTGTLSTLTATHWTVRGEGNGTGVRNVSGSASFVNSLFTGFGTALSGGGISADYSLLSNAEQCSDGAVCTNSVIGTPFFSGPWRTSEVSPGYNTGIDAGVTTDIEGTPRPNCGGYDIGAYEDNHALPVRNLMFDGAIVDNNVLTGSLVWQANYGDLDKAYDVRYSSTPLTDENFAAASQLAVITGGTTSYDVELPFSEGDRLYFAVVASDTCGTSPVSNNATPLIYDVLLPIIVVP